MMTASKGARLSLAEREDLELRKSMLRGALAAGAPTLVALVVLVSVDPDLVQGATGLGRLGLLSVGVALGVLAYMLMRARWWAGLPALGLMIYSAGLFTWKIVRPLSVYLMANPVDGVSDVLTPLFMLTPGMVLIVISVTLGVAIQRTMAQARRLAPLPVSRHAWVILGIWMALLLADLVAGGLG